MQFVYPLPSTCKASLQVKKEIFRRRKVENYIITPSWLCGFFQAEGSLITTKTQNPRIEISQHASDFFLLLCIRNFIGAGTVRFDLRKSYCVLYTLSDEKVISEKICPIFDRFLVLRNKIQLYENWKKLHFPKIVHCTAFAQKQITPQWFCGFTDGDGSFHCILRRMEDYKCKTQATMVFDLPEKEGPFMKEDLQKINLLFLANKGVLSKVKNMYHLKIVSIKTHESVVLPFFKKQPLQSRKSLHFFLFCKGCEMLLQKRQMTCTGIQTLYAYRQLMRQCRVFVSEMIQKLYKK